jgi:hypothetical protein
MKLLDFLKTSLGVTFFFNSIFCPNVLTISLLFTFFLEFALFFPVFSQQELPSLKN